MNNLLNEKKILIAGAGGLLGAKIVKYALAQGAQVIAADINVDLMQEKLRHQQVDLSCE
ncbi:flagellin modification protein A, partial [Photobacterium profundum]